MTETIDFDDPYEAALYNGLTINEVDETQQLIQDWDKATYPSVSASVVKHAEKHGFGNSYLLYLRKAKNFSKKGARRKYLPGGATRWNKGSEFLIERNGKIVTYGVNE